MKSLLRHDEGDPSERVLTEPGEPTVPARIVLKRLEGLKRAFRLGVIGSGAAFPLFTVSMAGVAWLVPSISRFLMFIGTYVAGAWLGFFLATLVSHWLVDQRIQTYAAIGSSADDPNPGSITGDSAR